MNDFYQELANGESEGIKFKRSTSLLKEAIQTLCAFGNHKGDVLYFTVDLFQQRRLQIEIGWLSLSTSYRQVADEGQKLSMENLEI